jgi:hypothetical protein|tara:strand:- start:16 stop:672 length:657 start_codon:yes stop_codon:yes gene_type:complete
VPFSTYSELKESIADWVNRDDFTTQIPDFITLAEADMQRALMTSNMELTTSLVTVANNPLVAVPTGFDGVRALRVFYDAIWHDVQNASLEPSLYNGVTNFRPVLYSIVGDSFKFRPTPNEAYSLELDYWAKFTPLSDAAPSNWILTNNPDAYLFGSLLAAAPFLGEDARMGMWQQGYSSAIGQINEEGVTRQLGKTKLRADPALTARGQVNAYNGRFW